MRTNLRRPLERGEIGASGSFGGLGICQNRRYAGGLEAGSSQPLPEGLDRDGDAAGILRCRSEEPA